MATTHAVSPSSGNRSHLYQNALAVLGVVVALGGSVAIGATPYGLWVFAGVVGLLGAIAVLLRPELGLYILYMFIFTNMSDVLETNFGVPDLNKFLVALIVVGTFASRVVLRREPLIFRMTEIVILLYGAAVIMSLFFAPGEAGGIGLVIDWLKEFAILLIIVQFATDEMVWKRAQWLLILTAALLGVFSTYQMITQDFGTEFFGLAKAPVFEVTEGFDSNRVTGPLEDPNFYGMVQLMVLPIALYRFFTDNNPRNRVIALGVSFFILAAVLATYSRGAFVALIVVGLMIVRERRLKVHRAGIVLALAVAIAVPFLPVGFVARISTLTNVTPSNLQNQEVSLRGRTSEMLVALEMFQDHPFLGVGRGNYVSNYLSYAAKLSLDNRNEPRQAHSLYLELAAETGVVGSVTFGLMLMMLFTGMWRARSTFISLGRLDLSHWVTGIQYGLVAYLLASIFLHADYIRYFWLIVGLAASCGVLAETQSRRFRDLHVVSRISPIT